MSKAQQAAYGPLVQVLWRGAQSRTLGPGIPHVGQRDSLLALTPESLVAPHPLADRQMAEACCAGLWLRHDYLDESHVISQEIDTPTGSFWHGIVHRREGDFSNAKYWFRRVGDHPIHASLATGARELLAGNELERRVESLFTDVWNPLAFVDLCQRGVAGPGPAHDVCLLIQDREWELLFDDGYRRAIGQI